jgi:hypothetical protein
MVLMQTVFSTPPMKVHEDSEKLQPEKAVEFHNLVAKNLDATK